MKHLCSPRSFLRLLVLLGAGSLLLLLRLRHLEDLTRKQPPGHDDVTGSADSGVSSQVFPKQGANHYAQVKIQELRHSLLANVCSEYQPGAMKQQVSERHVSNLLVEDQFRLLYCEVPHAGHSNWKRVLMVLAGKAESVLNIPQEKVDANVDLRRLKENSAIGIEQLLMSYTKVLLVREPFRRLVSGFLDKFENPNKPFHQELEPRTRHVRTLKTGATFREFVQCLLDRQCSEHGNPYWAPISQLCHPCLLQYHFICKLENAKTEGNFLLRYIKAPANVSYPDYEDGHPQGKRASSAFMGKYLSQLNAAERQGVYNFYRMDYLMFGYPKPYLP